MPRFNSSSVLQTGLVMKKESQFSRELGGIRWTFCSLGNRPFNRDLYYEKGPRPVPMRDAMLFIALVQRAWRGDARNF